MKTTKLFSVILLAVLLCGLFLLSSCTVDHTHHSGEWKNDELKHWKSCDECKITYDKADHEWDAGVFTTLPTETTEGVKSFTCIVCGQTKTENVPVLSEHEHTEK